MEISSLDSENNNVINILTRQINSFWDISEYENEILCEELPKVRKDIYLNFRHIKNKYYNNLSLQNVINCLHSSQYTIFLYKMSHLISKNHKNSLGQGLADKLYYLNKIMNSIDLYYQIDLPEIFFCDHPLASVMGRAQYSNFFSFAQGCTVGNNNGKYPKLGSYVRMCAHSAIIGDCNIGEYSVISTGCIIKDQNIPNYSLVFGQSPNLIIKTKDKDYMEKYFFDIWNI